jgi:hypothetical protein
MPLRFLTLALAALLAVPGPSPVAAAPSHYVFLDAPADNTYAWTVANWGAQYSDDDYLCSYSMSSTSPLTFYLSTICLPC